ncbi:MAG: type IVB secretion system apparatus protein IcmL/DotI [Coxiellaceae bacterium]|nr:type IVB secretion system apparatus protein IcmL/DotI [Coxiellaceae bacterium]
MDKINTESQDLLFQLNAFYRDSYRRTMRFLTTMIFICAVLAVVLVWMSFDKKQPAYYAALTTGEVVPMHPLSEPVLTSDFITEWSALTARSIYNLNFSSYQQQLAAIQSRFTEEGWVKLMNALNSSGMIKQIVDSRLIISSVVSGPPVVISEVVLHGRFTWRVQMLVLVTYTSASEQTQRTIVVTMDVQRVPTLDVSQGIQIVSFNAHNQV